MDRRRFHAGLMAMTILLGVGMAAGQTPDAGTPAVETTCDILHGATPALYGLCVAYCEAMDCTFDAFRAKACTPPDRSILVAYNNRKQPGDPDMPCLRATCPCFNASDLEAIGGASCSVDSSMTTIFNNNYLCPSYATAMITAGVPDNGSCLYTLKVWEDPMCIADRSFYQESLTDAETQACMDLIFAEAARSGLTCS